MKALEYQEPKMKINPSTLILYGLWFVLAIPFYVIFGVADSAVKSLRGRTGAPASTSAKTSFHPSRSSKEPLTQPPAGRG